MSGEHRRDFLTRFLPGLVLLLLVYLGLTAFRDYRDNYGVEIFAGLGYSTQPALFTATEVPVAVLVLVTLAALGLVKDAVTSLRVLFGIMLAGHVLLALATFSFAARAAEWHRVDDPNRFWRLPRIRVVQFLLVRSHHGGHAL